MLNFVQLVGISGSGKSTISEQYRNNGYNIYSSDENREELWGNAADQQNPQEVFQELHERVFDSLRRGESCVYDATNLSAKRRRDFINQLNKKGLFCRKTCVIVIAPYDVCVRRDHHRDRTVGKKVIQKQIHQFEVPYFNEGWDDIKLVTTYCPVVGEFRMTDKIIESMIGTEKDNHDNPHHSLTISKHMFEAGQYVAGKTEDWEPIIAARLHDIGKYYTKSFSKNGKKTKEAHFFNHQNVGAYIWLSSTCEYTYHSTYEIDIAFLIQHHMDHYFYSKEKMGEFYESVGEGMAEWMKLIEEADRFAH